MREEKLRTGARLWAPWGQESLLRPHIPPSHAQSWSIAGKGVQCKEHLIRSPIGRESHTYLLCVLVQVPLLLEPVCPSSAGIGTNDSTEPSRHLLESLWGSCSETGDPLRGVRLVTEVAIAAATLGSAAAGGTWNSGNVLSQTSARTGATILSQGWGLPIVHRIKKNKTPD